MLYKDENNNIQTTLYRKPTDQQAFLHAKSEVLCTVMISTVLSLNRRFWIDNMTKKFKMSKSRKLIELKEKNYSHITKKNNNKNSIPLSITYNRTLPNISKIGNRNWNILEINNKFHGLFQATPMIAFKLIKNLQEIIGGHTVKQAKVFKKNMARLNRKFEFLVVRRDHHYAVHKY